MLGIKITLKSAQHFKFRINLISLIAITELHLFVSSNILDLILLRHVRA